MALPASSQVKLSCHPVNNMPKYCPICGTRMEAWSEPDHEGTVWSFWLCPHCGCEVGLSDTPVQLEELEGRVTS